MGFLLKQIFAFLKLLNSETGTKQLAWGIVAGFILGMTPSLSLQSLLVFMCLFIFRIQIGAAFISAFFFSFIAYLLDPVFDSAGSMILEADSLHSLFTTLYNLPIVPLTRFNNSVVMGSGVVALLLSPVVYIASIVLITKYRRAVVDRFKQTKFWKAVQATGFYKWYYAYEKHFGS